MVYNDVKKTKEYKDAVIVEVFDRDEYEVDIPEEQLDHKEVASYKLNGGVLTVNLK